MLVVVLAVVSGACDGHISVFALASFVAFVFAYVIIVVVSAAAVVVVAVVVVAVVVVVVAAA